MGRNSPFGSATPLKHKGDDIVYSPNKYRETEGMKERKQNGRRYRALARRL